jgi:hypothetical protein
MTIFLSTTFVESGKSGILVLSRMLIGKKCY